MERVTSLRSRGADIVVALCHAGATAKMNGTIKTSSSEDITSIPGLDVVICGHTHDLVPAKEERQLLFRTLNHTTEAVMPIVQLGHKGRYVGCIDLKLQKSSTGWSWIKADCQNFEVLSAADPKISDIAAPWIHAADQATAKQIGQSKIDVSTHFSMVHCDPATRVAAVAKLRSARPLLEDMGYRDYPIIVAASPFKAGHDGPQCFSSVPAGPITLREVYDIYPYFNAIDAFEINGAQALDWLEASASVFFQIVAGQPDQPVWNRQFPTYEFDSILGLSYKIDLSQPAIYGPDRRRISEVSSSRIRNLTFNNAPVTPDQKLVLITNAYRGGGGGGFPHISNRNRIRLPFRDVRVSLQQLFADGLTDASLPRSPWRFSQMPETSVTFETGPDAERYIPSELENRLSDLGETAQGFRKFRLSLAA